MQLLKEERELARKRRKNRETENQADDSWLLPYADLMTLLLALFIVLFASSSIDNEKLEQLSEVFNDIFDGGQSFMDGATPVTTPNIIPDDSKEDVNPDSLDAYLEDQKSLASIQDKVDEYIAVHELENVFDTEMTDEGLLVTIRDSILFNPGKADVKEEYVLIADELSELLVFDPPRSIVVTGHTDNVPMNNAEFSSNWDLSVMRAVNFLRLMTENTNVDPQYFSAQGYGEYQSIATNSTKEGRDQNRRVEILIQSLVQQSEQ